MDNHNLSGKRANKRAAILKSARDVFGHFF